MYISTSQEKSEKHEFNLTMKQSHTKQGYCCSSSHHEQLLVVLSSTKALLLNAHDQLRFVKHILESKTHIYKELMKTMFYFIKSFLVV